MIEWLEGASSEYRGRLGDGAWHRGSYTIIKTKTCDSFSDVWKTAYIIHYGWHRLTDIKGKPLHSFSTITDAKDFIDTILNKKH